MSPSLIVFPGTCASFSGLSSCLMEEDGRHLWSLNQVLHNAQLDANGTGSIQEDFSKPNSPVLYSNHHSAQLYCRLCSPFIFTGLECATHIMLTSCLVKKTEDSNKITSDAFHRIHGQYISLTWQASRLQQRCFTLGKRVIYSASVTTGYCCLATITQPFHQESNTIIIIIYFFLKINHSFLLRNHIQGDTDCKIGSGGDISIENAQGVWLDCIIQVSFESFANI